MSAMTESAGASKTALWHGTSVVVPTTGFVYTLLTNFLILLWLPSASESFPQLNKTLLSEKNALGPKIGL
jgi:hypothetical protein